MTEFGKGFCDGSEYEYALRETRQRSGINPIAAADAAMVIEDRVY